MIEHLLRWNRPVPRYTSYPTAPNFVPLTQDDWKGPLQIFQTSEKPCSLYLHIPFCRSMCLFCGCSVILNRNPVRQSEYVELLIREIELLAPSVKKKVAQLHFGGGTPTSLTIEQIETLLHAIHRFFDVLPHAEISMEVDPRTVWEDEGEKLRELHRLGFNRISFGIQDLDPIVQEAVRRRQSKEMSQDTYELARSLGFEQINLDLIYGLPFQTPSQFSETIQTIAKWRPDRIALFSYAKIPWLKPHQKAMSEKSEPLVQEKMEMYVEARKILFHHGYIGIGMDHFALPSDSLAKAYVSKNLWRNFQGYSVRLAEDLVGIGITSIGHVGNAYFQNVKTISEYKSALDSNCLPIFRGFILNEEDRIRQWVIQTLMCHFALDKSLFEKQFSISFDSYFANTASARIHLIEEGLLQETEDHLSATSLGQLFIRIIASVFDAYLAPDLLQFSYSV